MKQFVSIILLVVLALAFVQGTATTKATTNATPTTAAVTTNGDTTGSRAKKFAGKVNAALDGGLALLGAVTTITNFASQMADNSQKTVVAEINLGGLQMIDGNPACFYLSDQDTNDQRRTWLIAAPTFCDTLSFEAAFDADGNDKEIKLRYKNMHSNSEIYFKIFWSDAANSFCVWLEDTKLLCLYDYTDQPQFKTMEEHYETIPLLGTTFKSNCYGGFDLANGYADTGTMYCSILPNNNYYNYAMELTGYNNCYFTQENDAFSLLEGDGDKAVYLDSTTQSQIIFKVFCNNQYLFHIKNYRHEFKIYNDIAGTTVVDQQSLSPGSIYTYKAFVGSKSISCVITKDQLRGLYIIENACSVQGMS